MEAELFFHAKFYGSFADYKQCPSGSPVVCFTGRSNSGKSSLISALCNHKNLARTSKQAGKTRTINYYQVQFKDRPSFFLVDMPGYGYAGMSGKERENLRRMIDEFLANCEDLKILFCVLDARREFGEEEKNIFHWASHTGQQMIFLRSKWDTMNQSERAKAKKLWNSENMEEYCLPVSSFKKMNLDKLVEVIESVLAFESN